jgi:hypothetical protein
MGTIHPVAAIAERKTLTAGHAALVGTWKRDAGTSLDADHTMGGLDLTIMAILGRSTRTAGTGVGTQ